MAERLRIVLLADRRAETIVVDPVDPPPPADLAFAARRAQPTPFVAMDGWHRLALIATFAAYLVLIAIARSQDVRPTDDWIFPALVLYVALVAAPLLVMRDSLGWFHPLVFSSILRLTDLVRRFAMYAWGLDHHRALALSRDELDDLVAYQLVLHALSVASTYFGYFLGPRLPMPRVWFPAARAMVPKLMVVFAISLAAFAAYIVGQGGLGAHMASWAGGRHETISGQHYQFTLVQLGVQASWMWLAVDRTAHRRPLFWATAIMMLVISFLLWGGRGAPVYAAIVGLMIWMLREQRLSIVRILALLVVAFYALTVLGSVRRGGDWASSGGSSFFDAISGKGELAERSSTSDGALPIYALVPNDEPLLYGQSYLAVLTLPIPRALFPGKPSMADGEVGRVFFHVEAGVPPGGVGEAYWNFHIPGVVIVFAAFGMFLRWLGRLFAAHRRAPAVIVMFASALFLFREPSGLSFVQWLLVLVPLLGIMRFIGVLRFGDAPALA